MKIYFSGFFFLLSITLSAQREAKPPFFFNEFGLSVNMAMPVGDDFEGRIGWGVGMHKVFWPQRNLNLVTGLVYNRINLYAEEMLTSRWHFRNEVDMRFNYIQVPALLRYGVGKTFRPFLEAGPILVIGLPSTFRGTEVTINPQGNDSSTNDFRDEHTPQTYLGFSGGLGIAIQNNEIFFIPKINYQLHTDLFGDSFGDNVHYLQLAMAVQF